VNNLPAPKLLEFDEVLDFLAISHSSLYNELSFQIYFSVSLLSIGQSWYLFRNQAHENSVNLYHIVAEKLDPAIVSEFLFFSKRESIFHIFNLCDRL
jgi:hypothetical protein